uniref:Prolyl 3-hydroxylase OGFOD1 n=1 Tax=Petromyzon marinus TaxID=7757 RepID=A0AAJ7U0Q8_PETMA|nr:prolyl 3-hydroxylase OGFOD1 [Petromyzon marinus]
MARGFSVHTYTHGAPSLSKMARGFSVHTRGAFPEQDGGAAPPRGTSPSSCPSVVVITRHARAARRENSAMSAKRPAGGDLREPEATTTTAANNNDNAKRRKEKEAGDDDREEARSEMASLSERILSSAVRSRASAAWRDGAPLAEEMGLEVCPGPFPHTVIPNFLQDEGGFLGRLQRELLALDFHHKSNDLYKFQQSDDLKERQEPCISALRTVLYQDFRAWLSEVLAVELEDTVDMFCAKYDYTDVLLCHDDELEGRRVAYILYLVPDWSEEDGGALQLFGVDENINPLSVVKSLVPAWNTLVFFEVSPMSYHQVSEVLSQSKRRLSVGGWFHGPGLPRLKRSLHIPLALTPHHPCDEEVLLEWVNPLYLTKETQISIQDQFQRESEIQLKGFLREEKFQALCDAVRESTIEWERRGPPHYRSYDAAAERLLPSPVCECLKLLRSEVLFMLLANFTGLKLHFLALGASGSESDDSEFQEDGESGGEGNNEHQNRQREGGSKRVKKSSAKGDGDESEGGSEDELGVAGDDGGDAERTAGGSPASSGATASREGGAGVEPSAGPSVGSSVGPAVRPSLCSADKGGNDAVPRCYGELRRWRHGSYTLIHDRDARHARYALDLLLYCGCSDWDSDWGGFTSYVAKDEDEELLAVFPENNCLALVYRDRDTLKFVKHVNHRSVGSAAVANGGGDDDDTAFYDFSFVYHEK